MPETPLQDVLIGALAGASWAGWGWANNAAKGHRKIHFLFAAKTIIIGAIAGAIVGAQGDALNVENIEATTLMVVPFVDKAFNTALSFFGADPLDNYTGPLEGLLDEPSLGNKTASEPDSGTTESPSSADDGPPYDGGNP